jgi:outer membrane protein TolC
MSTTPAGIQRMVADSYQNNPRFRVLDNAIKNAELQRQQAIQGQFDITAFVEGWQYPYGSQIYDNRLSGWEVDAGVNVRLNDQRVLKATRLKAEAQIREFKAQIEAERLELQRKISSQTATLQSNQKVRSEILDAIKQKQASFESRSKIYLSGGSLTIDDVLIPINELTSAEVQLISNQYYTGLAEIVLTAAMGEVYQAVGMKMDASGPVKGKR